MAAYQRRPTATTKTDASAADGIINKAKVFEKKVERALVVLWDDLEAWQQDNRYIVSGYRPTSNSFTKSFASLGYLHNEWMNIWTHLIGGLIFATIWTFLYYVIGPRYATADKADVVVMGSFFGGAVLCLGMSATFHAVMNHSEAVAGQANKLDYVGICFLITGSFIPAIYYGFHCHTHLRTVYWTMICSLGIICATVSLFDKFRKPAWRAFRASMFVCMGLSGLFPVIHGLHLYGYQEMRNTIGLDGVLVQAAFYLLGALIYATRWPENTKPGAYDIFGSSHQLFHILVLMAALSHLYGMLIAFDYHHNVILHQQWQRR